MRNLFFVSLLSISCTLSAGYGDDDFYSSDKIKLGAKIYNRKEVIQDLELRCKELISLELQTLDPKLQKLYQEKQDILAAQSAILEHHQSGLTLEAEAEKSFKNLIQQLLFNHQEMNKAISCSTLEINEVNGKSLPIQAPLLRDTTHPTMLPITYTRLTFPASSPHPNTLDLDPFRSRSTLLDNPPPKGYYLPPSQYEYGRPSKFQTVPPANNPPRPSAPLVLLDGTPTLTSYLRALIPNKPKSISISTTTTITTTERGAMPLNPSGQPSVTGSKRKRQPNLPLEDAAQHVNFPDLPKASCALLYFRRLGATLEEIQLAMGVADNTFKETVRHSLGGMTIPLKQLKKEADRYIQNPHKKRHQLALRALEKKFIEIGKAEVQKSLHMSKKPRVEKDSSSTPSSM